MVAPVPQTQSIFNFTYVPIKHANVGETFKGGRGGGKGLFKLGKKAKSHHSKTCQNTATTMQRVHIQHGEYQTLIESCDRRVDSFFSVKGNGNTIYVPKQKCQMINGEPVSCFYTLGNVTPTANYTIISSSQLRNSIQ